MCVVVRNESLPITTSHVTHITNIPHTQHTTYLNTKSNYTHIIIVRHPYITKTLLNTTK